MRRTKDGQMSGAKSPTAAEREPAASRAKDAAAEPVPEYWFEARTPAACLAFLLPMLLVYEVGALLVGDRDVAVRNGVDLWIRDAFAARGLAAPFWPPAIVVAALLVWQLVGRHPWRVKTETLAGMLAESLLFAFALIVLGQAQDLLFRELDVPRTLSVGTTAARAVTYVGAGIYEEVVFRLLLLPACFWLFRLGRLEPGWASALAVLSTSAAFSLAHYVGGAEAFDLFTFTFRTLSGVYFAALFVLRGFGVTVGCHASYDLVVGVLLAQ